MIRFRKLHLGWIAMLAVMIISGNAIAYHFKLGLPASQAISSGRSDEKSGITAAPSPQDPNHQLNISPQTPVSSSAYHIETNDTGFYAGQGRATAIAVPPAAQVEIVFTVLSQGTSCNGLIFRSEKFTTEPITMGQSATVTFVADRSFLIEAFCPMRGATLASVQVIFG